MTFVFICRKCAPMGSCAYLNSSTAFPYHIVKDLKCPLGEHMTPNWEFAEKVALHIPVNFRSTLSQESIRKSRNQPSIKSVCDALEGTEQREK